MLSLWVFLLVREKQLGTYLHNLKNKDILGKSLDDVFKSNAKHSLTRWISDRSAGFMTLCGRCELRQQLPKISKRGKFNLK